MLFQTIMLIYLINRQIVKIACKHFTFYSFFKIKYLLPKELKNSIRLKLNFVSLLFSRYNTSSDKFTFFRTNIN